MHSQESLVPLRLSALPSVSRIAFFPQPRLELQRWKRRPAPRVTVAYCLALSLAGMKRFDAKQQYIGDGWTSGSVRSPNHSLHVLPFESRPQILSDRVGLSSEKRCWLGNFPPKRNIFKAKVPLCLPETPKQCAKTYSRLIESFSVAFNKKKTTSPRATALALATWITASSFGKSERQRFSGSHRSQGIKPRLSPQHHAGFTPWIQSEICCLCAHWSHLVGWTPPISWCARAQNSRACCTLLQAAGWCWAEERLALFY